MGPGGKFLPEGRGSDFESTGFPRPALAQMMSANRAGLAAKAVNE